MQPQNRHSESLVCGRTCSWNLMQSLIEARKGFYLNTVHWEQRDRLEGILQNKENIIGRKRHLNAFSCAPPIVADSLPCIKSIFTLCGEGVIFLIAAALSWNQTGRYIKPKCRGTDALTPREGCEHVTEPRPSEWTCGGTRGFRKALLSSPQVKKGLISGFKDAY